MTVVNTDTILRAMHPGSETNDRRTRKREATRAALEQAAWELFQERGFAATTVEDITERVDVAERTFFRYFPSKDAVLFGDPRALETQFRAALLSRPPSEDISTALRAALINLAESVVAPARDRHLLRHRILQENGDPRVEDHLGALAAKSTMLREVIAERLGTSPSDPGAQLLGGITFTIMDVAYRHWINGGAKDAITATVEQTFDTLDRLLSHPSGELGVRIER
jgi:TetR/AcrR family transcriptional regulator, regulator of mycofactocin system